MCVRLCVCLCGALTGVVQERREAGGACCGEVGGGGPHRDLPVHGRPAAGHQGPRRRQEGGRYGGIPIALLHDLT